MDVEPEMIPTPNTQGGSGREEVSMEVGSDPELFRLPPLPKAFHATREPRETRDSRGRRREPQNADLRETSFNESPILGRRVAPGPPVTGRRKQETAGEDPPTVLRPLLQGKCTPLECNYPRGLRPEDREEYARVTARIDLLLRERERLTRDGARAVPQTSPPSTLPSSISLSRRIGDDYIAAAGRGGAEEKKGKGKAQQEAPPPKGRRAKENPPSKKTEPAGGSRNEPATRKQAKPASNRRTRPALPPQRADKAAPTSSQAQPGVTWTEVVGRKKRRTLARAAKGPASTAGPKPVTTANKPPSTSANKPPSTSAKKAPKRKVPRTAAISLHCPEGEYADAMRTVKANISLEALGIGVPHMRKGATGAFILEIAGENSSSKADALAARMSEVLAGKEGVRVGRPQKKADLRLRDVDDTATEAEIASAVATVGGCNAADVRVGPIRRSPRSSVG